MQNDIGIEICEIETASNVFDSFEMETCIRLRFNCGLSNALWHINEHRMEDFLLTIFSFSGRKILQQLCIKFSKKCFVITKLDI